MIQYKINKLSAILAAQLFLSHFLIGGLVLIGSDWWPDITASPISFLGLTALGGLLLTLNLQLTIRLTYTILLHLVDNLGLTPFSLHSHWPLSGLLTCLNALINNQQQTGQLREKLLTQTAESAAQTERNRLARDLHDSIKQQLFSIQVSAAAVGVRWEQDPAGAKTALTDVRQRAQEALVEMNAMLQQLAPAPLEKVGLIQSLHDQCEALGYRTGANVVPKIGDLPNDERLPIGAQETIFRIAQEALSNVARHARASHISLTLQQNLDQETLSLEIEDDGQGFESQKTTAGMGLTNIRQRASTLNGTVEITSTPGQGAKLELNIPLLKPIVAPEEPIYQKDYTLARILLTGLGSGLALIASLYYPLYILIPAQHIANPSSVWPILNLISQIVAALIVIGGGYLAVRWTGTSTRPTTIFLGSLTGGAAGITLFLGLAAAAAGLMGASSILEHGLVPAANETEYTQIVVEATIGIVWWTYGTLWGLLLAGIGLGALGGALAPLTRKAGKAPGL